MDGRAAYKGFSDCIRLLLFMDAHLGRADKEGEFAQVLEFFTSLSLCEISWFTVTHQELLCKLEDFGFLLLGLGASKNKKKLECSFRVHCTAGCLSLMPNRIYQQLCMNRLKL